MAIWDILERTATLMPDHIAVATVGQEVTYRRLAMDVDRLAAGFCALGLRPGDRIALLLPNSIELVTAFLAASRASLIVVPLPLDAPPLLHGLYLSDACPKAIVTDHALLSALPEASLKQIGTVVLTAGQAPGSTDYAHLMDTVPDNSLKGTCCRQDPIGLLVFTSGTTGRPKGIAHAQARLVERAEHLVNTLMLTDRDKTLLVFSPMRTPCLVYQVLAMLRVGGTVFLAGQPDSDMFWKLYAQARPTYTVVMPALARRLFEHPAAAVVDHSHVRFWISTGDHPGPELIRKAERTTGKPMLNMYGLTETGLVVAHPLNGPRKMGAMGKPLCGVDTRLADADGRDVKQGETGRLLVRTRNWMVGYWNDTLRTHQAIGSGWFDTQDLVCMDEDGYYWFRGRVQDVIVRNAINVASALVTDVLLEHPCVAEAVLVGMPDVVAGQVPVAFYRLQQTCDDPGEAALRALVAARVDPESIPVSFHRIDQWPLSQRGKVDRAGLIRIAQAGSQAN
jgi:acyl-coenzyme A synthetase/AMP-(fatty) acid ligase